ncbi:mannose-1-phosphate guanylyltransferase [Chloroflexota bacterium]
MTQATTHFYVLIMAGGGGTRLWPLSRRATPKQTLALVDEQQSMFAMTVRRLQPLLAPEQIFVVTGPGMVALLQADTPEIPAENFIIEPFGRNSGPAAGLGSMVIAERDPEAVIAVLSSDHHIADTARYRDVLAGAAQLASQQKFVTLGVKPSHPATEFGYIKRGELVGNFNGFNCYQADDFTEKPDANTAVQFLQTGLYSWNCGMFIWSAQQVLAEFARQQPTIHQLLMQIKEQLNRIDFVEAITPLWEQMPDISLDYAIMEDAPDTAVLPVDIGWSDVGSWDLLYDVLDRDDDGNITRGAGPEHIQINTTNTLILSDRMVVTIGVDDLVVVDTGDVVMVCHREHAQDVRQAVRRLKDKEANEYL